MVEARLAILTSGCFLPSYSSSGMMRARYEAGNLIFFFVIIFLIEVAFKVFYFVTFSKTVYSVRFRTVRACLRPSLRKGHTSISATSNGSNTFIATASVR